MATTIKRTITETVEIILGEHFLPALFAGDSTGLTDEEKSQLEATLRTHTARHKGMNGMAERGFRLVQGHWPPWRLQPREFPHLHLHPHRRRSGVIP